MGNSTSVSVGHGPGAPRNEGTAKDRSTPVPDSNLTEIEPTQEPDQKPGEGTTTISDKDKARLPPKTQGGA